ncbi:MAG: alpha/beta hydrolase [Rhodospirillales bacterium]|nr:alpha/beta hydrolase [Rhodospirillales bacterium]
MTVYRDYDLDALEAQYDIVSTIDDIDVYHAQYGGLSAKAVERLSGKLDIAYGDDPLQKLDAFPTASGGAPILAFIHGGYWAAGDKAGYRFPADTFHDAGAVWAPINYRLAPAVTLDDIVDDARSALAWIYKNAAEIGGDPDQLYVFGHSAGGHLAAMTLATGWHEKYGIPENAIKGGAPCSGLHDLNPFLHTSQKNYLNLDDAAVSRNSPMENLPPAGTKMVMAWGGLETPEFRRQSEDYAAACKTAGAEVTTHAYPEHNHFSLASELTNTESNLTASVFKMMGLN